MSTLKYTDEDISKLLTKVNSFSDKSKPILISNQEEFDKEGFLYSLLTKSITNDLSFPLLGSHFCIFPIKMQDTNSLYICVLIGILLLEKSNSRGISSRVLDCFELLEYNLYVLDYLRSFHDQINNCVFIVGLLKQGELEE